jgi:hypothetical protein
LYGISSRRLAENAGNAGSAKAPNAERQTPNAKRQTPNAERIFGIARSSGAAINSTELVQEVVSPS